LRRGLAIVWFLILPVVTYTTGMGVMAVGAMALLSSVPADVAHPLHLSSSTMSFDYPGNWWIADGEEDYDPETSVSVEPMQDAVVPRVCV
jgi:hypothetical protein